MNSYTFPIITAVTVLCIVVFRDRQRVRKYTNPETRLSKRDKQFATEACYEGLRCVGYSCAPGCDSPSEAAEAGAIYCKQKGLKAIVVASLVAAGMVAHYVARHRLSEHVAVAMLNTVNATLATAFGIAEKTIHDARAGVLSTESAARAVLDVVTQEGFRSSILAQADELGEALRRLID
jgi:hypothetical protein